MSLEVINMKKRKSNEQFCLFCDNSNDLVEEPRSKTLLNIKEATDRRKDSISREFSKLYNPDSTKQEFSWHQGCLATHTSEEKIYKEEEASAIVEKRTPNSCSSSRTPTAREKTLKCIFCKRVTRISNYIYDPEF
ncbi:hypothetical protein HHI36_018718 [Cryptolaemus montrouzieri]|uniref:Uncharacterized protein n=1 Tax=Cryptolaemus montrouzieri TaxID=559131 RepID=A0ABD2P1M7_9CUCU